MFFHFVFLICFINVQTIGFIVTFSICIQCTSGTDMSDKPLAFAVFCTFPSSSLLFQCLPVLSCLTNICESGSLHLTWWFPVPFIFSQITQFHSYSWIILHCAYMRTYVCVYHIFFMHISVNGHPGWFHNLVIVTMLEGSSWRTGW